MYLTVTMTMISPRSKSNIWFVMWADYNEIEDVERALSEDGILYGDRIFTEIQDGKTFEKEREKIIVGIHAVATIRACHMDFEPDPNPIYVEART